MIPLFSVFMSPEVDEELLRVLHSGYIGEGPKVKEFESKLADFIGNDKVLAVNNGTSALVLALHMANVEGKKVITTPLTCTATNFPILQNRAEIVWADIDPETGNISVESIEHLLREHRDVAAILPVHWGGYPCDLDRINEMASIYGCSVIEDACHSFGSFYKGKRIGNHSDFVCFSFQAIKHLTTVDGGLLVVNNDQSYQRGKLLRWYGINRETTGRSDLRCEEDIVEWGYKAHMNDVAATIGIANLKYIDSILYVHRINADYYLSELKDVDGVTLLKNEPDRDSAFWLFTMKVQRRDDFMKYMTENGVMTSKVHARNDLHFCMKPFKTELPNLEEFVKEMISIPVGGHVSADDREKIVELIKRGW